MTVVSTSEAEANRRFHDALVEASRQRKLLAGALSPQALDVANRLIGQLPKPTPLPFADFVEANLAKLNQALRPGTTKTPAEVDAAPVVQGAVFAVATTVGSWLIEPRGFQQVLVHEQHDALIQASLERAGSRMSEVPDLRDFFAELAQAHAEDHCPFDLLAKDLRNEWPNAPRYGILLMLGAWLGVRASLAKLR